MELEYGTLSYEKMSTDSLIQRICFNTAEHFISAVQVSGPLSMTYPTLLCLTPRRPPCQPLGSRKETADASKKQGQRKPLTFTSHRYWQLISAIIH